MARRGDGLYQRGKTWYLDFTHEGQRHVTRLGKGITRSVAVELATIQRGKILKGEVGIGGPPSIPLAEYSARWLKQIKGQIAPATFKSYHLLLRAYILPTLGQTRV